MTLSEFLIYCANDKTEYDLYFTHTYGRTDAYSLLLLFRTNRYCLGYISSQFDINTKVPIDSYQLYENMNTVLKTIRDDNMCDILKNTINTIERNNKIDNFLD